MDNENTNITLFEKQHVRRVWHENQWWLAITDVIAVLIENQRPRKYWNDLKKKMMQEGYVEVSENIGQLKMQANDHKFYLSWKNAKRY